MMIVAGRAVARIGVHALQRFELDVVEAEHRREAELVVRRLEDRVALVVDELGCQVLDRRPLVGAAEHVDAAGAICRDAADRRRHFTQLVDGVGNDAEIEEPVVVHGPVGLQHVAVVRVPPAFFVAERVDDAPTVGHGHGVDVVGETRPRNRRDVSRRRTLNHSTTRCAPRVFLRLRIRLCRRCLTRLRALFGTRHFGVAGTATLDDAARVVLVAGFCGGRRRRQQDQGKRHERGVVFHVTSPRTRCRRCCSGMATVDIARSADASPCAITVSARRSVGRVAERAAEEYAGNVHTEERDHVVLIDAVTGHAHGRR